MAYKAIACRKGRTLSFPEIKQAKAIREAFELQMAKRGITVEEAGEPDAETTGDDKSGQGPY
jgi:hypothetical protein